MPNRVIIMEGTSYGMGGYPTLPTLPTGWVIYANILGLSSPTTMGTNFSTGAATVSGPTNSYRSRMSLVQAAYVPGTLNILSVEGHANSPVDAGGLADILDYCNTMRNFGFVVVASTAMPAGYPPGLGSNRQALFNPGLRAAVGNQIDAVCDWGADPIIGVDNAVLNPYLYVGDYVHPKGYSWVYMGNIMWRTLNTLNVSGSRNLRLG
jgi:hypothetical protein